jgi:glycosyltransferase involved in cell wall biosynthesis
MNPPRRPLLSVVVVARDEAAHIRGCLDSVLRALAHFEGVRVVVVDSDSSDGTAEIAAALPVEVYRYRSRTRTAAAGRRIGTGIVRSRYVLFIDGDCRLEPRWLPAALARMERDPSLAVVYGTRREVYENAADDFVSAADPSEAGLGGNALYRRRALLEVGGFHPFLPAEEEGELLGRLRAHGYAAECTGGLMFTHYTLPKDTWRGQLRRALRRMALGTGKVLRLAARDGSLGYHARRFNRELLTLVYLAYGAAIAAGVAFGAPRRLAALWILVGGVAFTALWWRRRRLRSALYIATEWLTGAVGIAIGALLPIPDSRSFRPSVERVRPQPRPVEGGARDVFSCSEVLDPPPVA